MSTQLRCSCGNDSFLINGWQVTEDLVEDKRHPDAYDDEDIGKADIVEVMCEECETHIMSVEGGRI